MRDARPVFASPRPKSGFPPVIEAKPLSAGELSALQGRGMGSGLLDPTRTGTNPARVAQIRAHGGIGPSLDDALRGTAGQLRDALVFGAPNHPTQRDDSARLVDLAAMFVPNGRGGRFEGALTPEQKRFMNQLQGIVDIQQIPGPPGHGGTVPYPEPIWRQTSPNAMKGSLNIDTAGSREIAEKLGYVGGDALSDLLNSVHRQGDSFAQTYGKLGATEGGSLPSWVTTSSELKLWGMYKHDPSHLAALAGMKDDVRAALAQIIDTINRRGPGGPGLSGYGAN